MNRRRHADVPTEALFAMPPAAVHNGSAGETAARPKVVGWVGCPECISRPRVAVIRSGSHLIYRPHDYPTWSGARMDCRASGVAICELKPKPYDGPTVEACTCGRHP